MVKEYFRPASLDEAFRLLVPGAAWLAGGTSLLCTGSPSVPGNRTRSQLPERIIDLRLLLKSGVRRSAEGLTVEAGTTFEELLESAETPEAVRMAVRSMANRNIRNRATVGGNLAEHKSCASLVPVLLVLRARVRFALSASESSEQELADWLEQPKGLILSVSLPEASGRLALSRHSGRTACDVATVVVALSGRLEAAPAAGPTLRNLRIAVGGFGPRAALRPDLAALFEGKPLPAMDEIVAQVRPLLAPLGDVRGSADLKRQLGASILGELLFEAIGAKAEVRA